MIKLIRPNVGNIDSWINLNEETFILFLWNSGATKDSDLHPHRLVAVSFHSISSRACQGHPPSWGMRLHSCVMVAIIHQSASLISYILSIQD